MKIEDKSIKNELLYFKEEVLKDVRFELEKVTSRLDNQKDSFSEKIISFETKFTAMTEKIINLSNSIFEDKSLKEKVSKFMDFQQNTKDILILHDSKIKTLSKNLLDSINRIDLFINNNILYNDVIGPTTNCKFKNFHEFIDHVLKNITQLNKFKDSIIALDIKNYKTKIEAKIESLRNQFINSCNENNSYTKKLIEKEEKNRELLEQKIDDIKKSDDNNIDNLKNKLGSMLKELDKIDIIKEEIHERIDKEVLDMSKKSNQIESNFEEHKMIYIQQNNAIKNSIKDIYIQLERLLYNKSNSNSNDNYNFYPIQNRKREEINDIKYDAIETEQQKITSIKNDDIKKVNNSYREILEDKKEEIIKEKKRYNSSKRENIVSKESLIKPYIDGKVSYEQAFIKRFQKKIIDDKKSKDSKKYPLEYDDNKNINVNYSDIVMNIYNNQGIKNIYNTKFKEVQNFIDKIIIGSVLNPNIKIRKTKINNNVSSDFLNSKFKFNRNLKFDEISNLANKEHLSSSNNEIRNDSNKEDINNKKNNNYLIKKRKYSETNKYFNQIIEQSMLKEKNNFLEKLLNNGSSNNTLNIGSSINVKKISINKNVKRQNDIKKSSSFDIEQNNSSNNNNNNYIDIIDNNNKKQNIYPDINNSQVEKNKKIISIINYSNRTQSQNFYHKKSKSKLDLTMPSLIENYNNNNNNYGAIKLHKTILLNCDKKSIKNKFNMNNLSNKISNNNLSYYDLDNNANYTKKDLEFVAKKKIQNSMKNSDNKEKI